MPQRLRKIPQAFRQVRAPRQKTGITLKRQTCGNDDPLGAILA
jgi:hypothetical protein